MVSTKPSLLIICQTLIQSHMAGPSLRYLALARTLSKDMKVILAAPVAKGVGAEEFEWLIYGEAPASLIRAAQDVDFVLLSGYVLQKFPALNKIRACRIVDLYDPMPLENLFYRADDPMKVRLSAHESDVEVFNRLVRAGDFFVCGSERQRDFWLGVLMANLRLNPMNFRGDEDFRGLIDVVSTGLPSHEKPQTSFLIGEDPAVPLGSKLILWGGGIWNWLDPLILLEAFLNIHQAHPEARLVFLGARHPNPEVPAHEMAARTLARANESGLVGKQILFFDWLSVPEREALLCESHIGVVAHPAHIETRFSLRTRVFDYFWARLPVLATAGDVVSEWVSAYGVGEVVAPGQAAEMAAALDALLSQPKSDFSDRFDALHARFSWKNQAEPLRRYCLQGRSAEDKPWLADRVDMKMSRIERILRQEGLGALLKAGWRKLTKK
jgi:glycosyltransferase involved in cell wall biosynthesis